MDSSNKNLHKVRTRTIFSIVLAFMIFGGFSYLYIKISQQSIMYGEVKINLDEIQVQRTVEHSQEIEITKDIKLNLRYPRLKDLKGLNDNFGEFEQSMIMVYECIDSVVNGEEIITRIDMTQDEITEFIDSFNTEQLENVMKFFETMPKLRHVIDVTNPKTKVKSEVLLEGLESFLE